jgi:PKD repeat protein
MKKIITILIALLTCISVVVKAQPGTICNAQFTTTISGSTVQCTPTSLNTSALLQHQWQFGDGNYAYIANPSNTYTTGGVYTIKHIVVYRSQNDSMVICSDTASSSITISGTIACTIKASFSFFRDSIQTNKVYFNNTTTPIDSSNSYRWSFGDGTFSIEKNPIHLFPSSGLFTVCLTSIKNNCVDDTCRQVQIQVTNTCTIAPNFSSFADSLFSNKIYFTNLTSGLLPTDSVTWYFGDGGVANTVNAVHSYNQGGTYRVCLQVKRTTAGAPACIREFCKNIIVTANSNCNLQVSFYQYRDTASGTALLNYRFENTTTPFAIGDSAIWNFGDGTTLIGTNGSPNHIYVNGGNYTVCLTIKRRLSPSSNSFCIVTYCKVISVEAPCTYLVNFAATRDSSASNTYLFTNTTTPINSTDSLFWNFGDGTPLVYNAQNTRHAFATSGTYNVCLTVKRLSTVSATGFCIKTYCKLVTVVVVNPNCNLQAKFTWTRTGTGLAPRVVSFTNTSTGINSNTLYTWQFGDSSTSNLTNPIHTYATAGNYWVCLKATINNTCFNDTCILINLIDSVPPNPCNFTVAFTKRVDSINSKKWFFTNTTNITRTTTAAAIWNFGDGTSATSWNADHVYAQPGRYTVCLTINNGANCVKTTCDTIVISSTTPLNCDSIRLAYTYRRDGYMPNKYFFFANGNGVITNQKWTITKMPATAGTAPVVLNINNPVYVFADTGNYSVCLNATIAGCSKQYCSQIRVSSNTLPNQCVIQAYPNPTHNNVNVNVQLNAPELISVYIYNSQNILVGLKTQQGFTGNNLINMNISILTQGFYTLRIVHGNKICYSRFMKI